ncbi:MAG: thiosulfate oxidation carrier protein SoxY, partial [Gammaproteobacteria bacterium]|nr:thiosulfate oxidation carrier protein SoxY [Gammaproteobacteria bacterium]
MNTSMKRRIFLKGSMAASAVGVAVGAGLLTPHAEVFQAKEAAAGLKALLGSDASEQSADIEVKAPDIAENGAVVPITVETKLKNLESITVVAVKNPAPVIATYAMGKGADGFVSMRIKMGATGDVVAVVKSGGKLFSNKKEVKVTVG